MTRLAAVPFDSMSLRDFVVGAIEQAGGIAEPSGQGRIDALLPAVLEPTGVEREARLALDPETPDEASRAELIMIGSPLLDRIIVSASGRGITSAAHLPCERPKQKGLHEEVQRTLRLSNCRVRPDPDPPTVLHAEIVQFDFKTVFFSDERRERLYSVFMNSWSGRPNPALIDHVTTAVAADRKPAGIADAPRVPMAQAYAAAQEALRGLMGEEVAAHRARIRKRFGVEHLRICDYYEQIGRELSRRRRDSDADAGRVLDAKLAAVRAERERKLRELGEKYRLRPQVKLISARALSQAKTFFKLLIDRGSITRTLVLAYDSLLGRLEPPLCDACRSEMTRINVTQRARLLCPACMEAAGAAWVFDSSGRRGRALVEGVRSQGPA